ncbi:NAAT family transporter [Bacillus subtilis]|uniref:NAAT family transporter n=1 Tax=Bacillus subtilis TaxID=1423 RepID=UPI0021664E41|nr:NAAT family transporter [Bacillus subtilis]MEC0453475.1 NAAT family transporter [Bacillus subtilis]UVW12943.1 NAAT family transporter [Bacillus subtilis]
MMFSFIVHVLISLFAVSNPIGNVPIFLTLTEGYTAAERKAIARKAAILSFFILAAFLVFGHLIFKLFDINIHALRVAGGIFIFGIAYNLLNAKESHVQSLHHDEHKESKEKADISVTPLSIPIIAGPGTIATVMSLSAGHSGIGHYAAVMIGIAAVIALTFLFFHYSAFISSKLGKTEMNVITRLMGLILAVVAVGMIGAGLKGMFPILTS